MRHRAVHSHHLDTPPSLETSAPGTVGNHSRMSERHNHHQHNHHQGEGVRVINAWSLSQAAIYVLSGSSQPLFLQLLRNAGLANAKAQLYMWFYYFGPALVLVPLLWRGDPWPRTIKSLMVKAFGIALFDTMVASLNYAGASMCGPTIFAIIYSSVTVWTAVFSQMCLGRRMNAWQWASVTTVFGGLALTATDSLQLGKAVVQGCALVILGSAMHAMTYILCEAIMTVGEETLSVAQNCGIQATVAATVLGIWQLVYTIPRWQEIIGGPMQEANTTLLGAMVLLLLFSFLNWVHSVTFYETLVHFPGGATSAGVMKGLQAVLVFGLTDLAFCGTTGGEEMCFTKAKFISLVTVVGGVISYGIATQRSQPVVDHGGSVRTPSTDGPGRRQVYESIDSQDHDHDVELEGIKS
jgi:drug/metabolite transporter (DMT)-like permease